MTIKKDIQKANFIKIILKNIILIIIFKTLNYSSEFQQAYVQVKDAQNHEARYNRTSQDEGQAQLIYL
jgi:hypothetical protein